MSARTASAGLSIAIAVIAGCAQSPEAAKPEPPPLQSQPHPSSVVSHGGPVRDHVSLVDNLRRRGLKVDIAGPARELHAATAAVVLRVSGPGLGPVEITSYDRGTAETASRLQGGGHLYRSERVLVLYHGDDKPLVRLLGDLLGPDGK